MTEQINAATETNTEAAGDEAQASQTTSLLTETGEQKAESADSAEQQDKSEDSSEAEKPIEYEAFKLPEGVELDDTLLGEFTPLAKELKLTQEQAQKLIDLQAKSVQQMSEQMSERMESEHLTRVKEWADKARADEEFGGARFAESINGAKSALKKFGTPELETLLNETGFGNHPEVIRVFHKISKLVSEDAVIASGQGGAKPQDPAKLLYPNMN